MINPILVLDLGLLLLALSQTMGHWDQIKALYARFERWCLSDGILGLFVYTAVCGLLVAVVAWEW